MRLTKELIGHIGIDSGQVIICDPCYLKEFTDHEFHNAGDKEEKVDEFSYNGCCNATLTKGAGPLGVKYNNEIREGWGIASSTGYGDGSYPVYAYRNHEGRIMKLVVLFK